MRRFLSRVGLVALMAGFFAPDASAQQSVNVYLGGFVPPDYYSRDVDDVLVNNADFLAFNFDDFSGFTFGGEWLVGLGDLFDAGIGVGYYQQTAPAVYYDFVNANGSEIRQDLQLRIVPITATFRFLPLGHRSFMRPYVGAGVDLQLAGSESGEFVADDTSIFRDTFEGTERRHPRARRLYVPGQADSAPNSAISMPRNAAWKGSPPRVDPRVELSSSRTSAS